MSTDSNPSFDAPTLRALGVICERHTAARSGEPTDPPTWFGHATIDGSRLYVSIVQAEYRKPHARWLIQADLLGVRRELREGGEPGATFEEAHVEATRQAAVVGNGAKALAQLASRST